MKKDRRKIDRLIKIISALRWAVVVAIPLSFAAEIAEYAYKNGSSGLGIGRMFYDAALNSSGSEWAEIIKIICVLISTASFIMCAIFYSQDKKERMLNIGAAVGLLVLYAVTLRQ